MEFWWAMLGLLAFVVLIFEPFSEVLDQFPRVWRPVAAVILFALICIAVARIILMFAGDRSRA